MQTIAIKYAAGIHAGRPKGFDDFLERRLTRRHHGMGYDIGIDDRDAELLEDAGHGGFAAADAARQSDYQWTVIPPPGSEGPVSVCATAERPEASADTDRGCLVPTRA